MARRRLAAVLLLCLPMHALAAPTPERAGAARDWAAWRGPEQNSISTETDWDPARLAGGPKIVWQTNVGNGWGAVAIKGERVYVMGNRTNQDSVFCLKIADGAEIWKHTYACPQGKDGYPGPRATPTVDDQGVYTLSREGHVFCLDPASGAVRWQVSLPEECQARAPQWGFASSARVTGDMVLFNAGAHGVALDRKTGRKIWASPPGVGNYAVPVLYEFRGRGCAAIFGREDLVGVEIASGRRLWSIPWKRDYDIMAAEPIVSGDHIFVTSGYGKGSALFKLGDGEPQPVWESKVLSCQLVTPALLDGHLYGTDGNVGRGDIKCVEFLTGVQKWVQKNVGHAQVMAAGGKLILLTEAGELIVAEARPDGYKELARAKVLDPKGGKCWTMPVLCRGRIYCRSSPGDLAVVDVSRP